MNCDFASGSQMKGENKKFFLIHILRWWIKYTAKFDVHQGYDEHYVNIWVSIGHKAFYALQCASKISKESTFFIEKVTSYLCQINIYKYISTAPSLIYSTFSKKRFNIPGWNKSSKGHSIIWTKFAPGTIKSMIWIPPKKMTYTRWC